MRPCNSSRWSYRLKQWCCSRARIQQTDVGTVHAIHHVGVICSNIGGRAALGSVADCIWLRGSRIQQTDVRPCRPRFRGRAALGLTGSRIQQTDVRPCNSSRWSYRLKQWCCSRARIQQTDVGTVHAIHHVGVICSNIGGRAALGSVADCIWLRGSRIQQTDVRPCQYANYRNSKKYKCVWAG